MFMALHGFTKSHCGCQDGSKNLFSLMKQRQLLNKRDQDIVFPVLQNNSYFAYSKHVLIAAICDDNLDVQRQAVEIIISSGQRVQPSAVCIFDRNDIKLNFPAEIYFDMIDLNNCEVTPPSLLSRVQR